MIRVGKVKSGPVRRMVKAAWTSPSFCSWTVSELTLNETTGTVVHTYTHTHTNERDKGKRQTHINYHSQYTLLYITYFNAIKNDLLDSLLM